MCRANPGIGDIFENWKFKISSKLWWLQLRVWYQIKGPITIFHLKGHAVKLKCVNYKIEKNVIFAKNAFLKLENIHKFDTSFTH